MNAVYREHMFSVAILLHRHDFTYCLIIMAYCYVLSVEEETLLIPPISTPIWNKPMLMQKSLPAKASLAWFNDSIISAPAPSLPGTFWRFLLVKSKITSKEKQPCDNNRNIKINQIRASCLNAWVIINWSVTLLQCYYRTVTILIQLKQYFCVNALITKMFKVQTIASFLRPNLLLVAYLHFASAFK